MNHALALLGLNRTGEAREAARRARDEAANQGQEEILGIALRTYGVVLLAAGDDAVASMSESVARLGGVGKTVDEARSRRALAEALERSGDIIRANREREKAAKLLNSVGLTQQAEASALRPSRLVDLAFAPRVGAGKAKRAMAPEDLF